METTDGFTQLNQFLYAYSQNENCDFETVSSLIRDLAKFQPERLATEVAHSYIWKGELKNRSQLNDILIPIFRDLTDQGDINLRLEFNASLARLLYAQGDYKGVISLLTPLFNANLFNERTVELLAQAYCIGSEDSYGKVILNQALEAVPTLLLGKKQDFFEKQCQAQRRGLPSLFINTIPKTGSEYITSKMAEGLNLPRIRICHPQLQQDLDVVPAAVRIFSQGGALAKEHLPCTLYNLEQLQMNGFRKFIIHSRDPRQQMLAEMFPNINNLKAKCGHEYNVLLKRGWPVDFASWPLEEQIDFAIEKTIPYWTNFLEAWIDFSATRDNLEIKFTSYESFTKNQTAFFQDILAFYEIDKSLFDWHVLDVGVEKGRYNFRVGKVDEWRDLFSKRQVERAWKMIPDSVKKLLALSK